MRHQLHLIKTWLIKAKPTTVRQSESISLIILCSILSSFFPPPLSLSLSLRRFSWPCHVSWFMDTLGKRDAAPEFIFQTSSDVIDVAELGKMNIRFRRKNGVTNVCNTWDFSTEKRAEKRKFWAGNCVKLWIVLIDRLVFLAGKSFPVTSKLAWEI